MTVRLFCSPPDGRAIPNRAAVRPCYRAGEVVALRSYYGSSKRPNHCRFYARLSLRTRRGCGVGYPFHECGVAPVDTHYNELANDGRTIYAATRSTAQLEFKPLSEWPLAVITSGDQRLMIDASSPARPDHHPGKSTGDHTPPARHFLDYGNSVGEWHDQHTPGTR